MSVHAKQPSLLQTIHEQGTEKGPSVLQVTSTKFVHCRALSALRNTTKGLKPETPKFPASPMADALGMGCQKALTVRRGSTENDIELMHLPRAFDIKWHHMAS